MLFWSSLSLTFAAIYGILSLQKALESEYVVQDDARMYLFWMQQFINPDILPHDLNVNYHKSISPVGYTALYWLAAKLGIQPLLLSKLLPTMLGLVATAYGFGVCLQILPVPEAAFTSMLLMNQSWWLKDDVVSATPRAFIYPLFLAFLYYLLRGALLPVVLVIGLLGLFYPPLMLVSVGILIVRLGCWRRGRFHFSCNRSDYILCGCGLGVALIVVVPYALATSEFGPFVTAAQARTWPEFSAEGRIPVFNNNPWKYWCTGIHTSLRFSINPPLVGTGLLLPLLRRYPSRFPLVKQLSQNITILLQILLVSLSLFFAAHALIFKLFLPSRYMAHSLLIIMAIAGGIAITIILDAIFCTYQRPLQPVWKRWVGWVVTFLIGITLILYPNIFWKNFTRSGYFLGQEPALYKFFEQQRKNILIASLSEEAFNVSTFSHRSVLVTRKLALPYHVGYYRQVRQRTMDLIRAQYTPDLAEIQNFIQKYGVDYWLVERKAFIRPYLNNNWLKMFQPAYSEAVATLEQGRIPVLATMMKPCSVFETRNLVVLATKCIAKARS